MNLNLSFYNFECVINSDNPEVLNKLEKDFSYFIRKKDKKIKKTEIVLEKVEKFDLPSGLVATKQTQNAITYIYDGIKYNNYYDDALTITNKNKIKVQYKDEKVLHEIVYLIILSHSGKAMDVSGKHKVHACGISYKESSVLVMMPSKGGKTTLMLDLIMDPEVSFISDDSPVITRSGKIEPFPLRLGVEDKNDLIKRFPYIDEQQIYSFKRKYFSPKYLLPVSKLKNSVYVGEKKTILVAGKRFSGDKSKIVKIGKFKMFKHLGQHMIVGIGLPLIIEHFFRIGWKDYFTNLFIFASRVISAFCLVMRADSYEIYLSRNRMENRKLILELASEG